MDINNSLSHLWSYCLGWKIKGDYIPYDVQNPEQISAHKKHTVKKAVLWLLAKAPHSVGEIAEHYALNPQLVEGILNELDEEKMVLKITGDTTRYEVKNPGDYTATGKKPLKRY